MDPVKRKVISELFFAPSVVLPMVGGISAGLLSWASGGSSYLTGAAIVGVLGGLGWMLTRMIFKVEDITEAALQAELDKKLNEENQTLDSLAAKLRTDRDHRTQDYLTLLRSIRAEFEQSAHNPERTFRSGPIRDQVANVFHATVRQLEQSYKLWELSENLVGESRKKILQDREVLLEEINETIDRLKDTVQQFHELVDRRQNVDLAAMREELDATMRIAKRTEERMKNMGRSDVNYEEYSSE